MKSFILFAIFFAYASAVGSSVWYAGTTVGGASAPYPTWDGTTCTYSSTDTSPYAASTVVITASTWYWVTAQFQYSDANDIFFSEYATLAIYPTGTNTYTTTDPCTNAIIIVNSVEGEVPNVWFPIQLAAGTYTVVVTSTYGESTESNGNGIFSYHIDPVDWVNATTNAGPFWYVADSDVVGQCESDSGDYQYAYAYYKWVQPTTGYYDVLVLFQNMSTDSYADIEISLWNGTQSWLGTGTFATPVDPCAGTNGAGFMISNDEYLDRVTEYLGLSQSQLYHQWLVAGTTYTLVVSSDDDVISFGWVTSRIVPTTLFQAGTTANFVYPDYEEATCTSSDDTATNWGSNTWTANYTTYLVGSQNIDDYYFDDEELSPILSLYSGATFSPATPCQAGWIETIDEDESLGYSAFTVGTQYTAVVANYDDGTETWYQLMIMGGPTGGSSTAGTSASGSAGTSAGTSASGSATAGTSASAGTSAGVTGSHTSAGTSAGGSGTASTTNNAVSMVINTLVVLAAVAVAIF